ncbi:hypothetical protein HDV63DRAFT_61335 [Trichoderma sp. SZMC 28014]
MYLVAAQTPPYCPYSSIRSKIKLFCHLYNLYLYSILILIMSLVSSLSPTPQIRPRSSSRLRGSPSAPPARSSSLIGASAPRHFLSRLADKLFFFLYSALPAFIGGSVSGGTYNFFSWGRVRHHNCLRVLYLADTAFILRNSPLGRSNTPELRPTISNARISALAT